MSEFTDEQIEMETEKMVEGQIADHLETLGDRDYLVPHDIEDAYGSWLEVTHAARAYRDLANGERVEPDYEAAAKAINREFSGDSRTDWVIQQQATVIARLAVDAAIGDKLLIDPPTEED